MMFCLLSCTTRPIAPSRTSIDGWGREDVCKSVCVRACVRAGGRVRLFVRMCLKR
jgi:hypothetical protein